MDELAVSRKLASIVAVDVAGYSRRAEADEDAAVRAVGVLSEHIARTACTRGGRVFNTAGDGFMLEFPTVSGALAAAEQIAGAGDPPVRVGVHLGEVSVTESGDLLGHGVNVAARIQQMAAPGAVLVSGDVKRAVRGPLGARLRPQGSVRLDKMSETLPVFALSPAQGAKAKGRRRSWKMPVLAGASVAFMALAGFALWPGHGLVPRAESAPSRLAILPFEPLTSSPQERAFATGLADELQSVLGGSQMPLVSREDVQTLRGAGRASGLRNLRVRLLFDGTVALDGDTLRARVHLDDPGKHATLWTLDLSGPASSPDALEAQVGARAIAVLTCAGQALRPGEGLSDAEALALYLHACDLFETRVWGDDPQAVYGTLDAFRQAARRAPGFAPGHAALARFLAGFRQGQALQGEPAAAEAEQQARRALALDPKNADAYVALSLLRPESDYAGREALLDQALAMNPSWAYANLEKANLLFDVGRFAEGGAALERAAAANPLSLYATTDVVRVANGRTASGNAELERLQRLWPHSPTVWFDALQVYRMEQRWNDLSALLNDRMSRPKSFTDSEIQLMRTDLVATKTRRPEAIAEARRQFLTSPARVPEALISRFQTLADLGLTDDAIHLADQWSKSPLTAFNAPKYLFQPGGERLRRDPRFIALAARLGLVDYWRATGKWPDFCAGPRLPYDCKAEAAKSARRS